MKRSETKTTVTIRATTGSARRNPIPSRARRGSPSASGVPTRRTESESAARPTTTNDAASTSIAAVIPPAATRSPPQSGPSVKPSARAVSTVPFAFWSGRPPATTGMRANSAACATRSRRRAAPPGRTAAPASAEAQARLRRRPARGDDEEERAGLHPVDEQPDVAGKEHDGRPEADEDRGDRDAAAHPVAGELLRLERERDERDPVADARHEDRAGDNAEVSVSDLTRRRHRRSITRASARLLEGVRREAPGGRGVPDPEREARDAERRRDAGRPTGRRSGS